MCGEGRSMSVRENEVEEEVVVRKEADVELMRFGGANGSAWDFWR